MDYTPSRFIRKTLMPNERCIKDARFSWIYTVQAWLTWALCSGIGYGIYYAARRFLGMDDLRPFYACAAVGFFLFFDMLLKKWTTEIILTNERLIYKYGFFFLKTQEVDIEQLASDKVAQGPIGRLFDYGEIHIRCIEADDIWLPPITKPYEFRNALERQKHDYREHYMKVERLRRHGDQAKNG